MGHARNQLRCKLFNARSIMNKKLPDWHNVLYCGDYNCIFVTESWLYPAVPNGLLDPKNQYTILRNDRSIHKGGGVCVFVSNELRLHELSLVESEHFADEEVDVAIFDIISKSSKCRFILVYRRPKHGAIGGNAARQLCKIMGRHLNCSGPVFILGDLNCPSIDWNFSRPPSSSAELPIYEFCLSNGFTQCVDEATRGNHTLDVVCTNEPFRISNISVQPPFVDSDHDSVEFQVLLYGEVNVTDTDNKCGGGDTAKHYLWSQGDYDALSEYLNSIDWQQMLVANLTPDTIWSAFCEILDSAVDMFVPSINVTATGKKFKPRHYPKHIRNLLARKLAVWKTYKTNRSDAQLKSKYNKLQSDCSDAIRKFEMCKENKVINSGNIGDFYKYVNKRMSSRSAVGALMMPGGDVAQNDADKANVLNDHFGAVCTHDDGSDPKLASPSTPGQGINSVQFDSSKLLSAVRRIKTKSSTSCGPDGYPVILLRSTAGVLAQPLSDIFTSFMSVGKLPSVWKTATVTPIYKKGPSADPSNYRPVSQTSIFCKLLERVLVADVTTYMKNRGFITKHQHGFINGRSTTTNLLESLSDWTFAIDNKTTQTVIYVDFSKAFDSVSHPKLITKLQGYGIQGDLLHLITDFLTGRTQRTRVGRCLSNSINITSGVVQGSCLGPLLFLIFINDLAGIFDSTIKPKLYADDLKLYATVESSLDSDRLQRNIDRMVEWSDYWQLSISIKKCQVLQVGSSRHNAFAPTYSIGPNVLPNCDTVTDLGVTVDHELKFSPHINLMVRKALTRSNLLMKCFLSRDRSTLVRAFVVYIRPMLEYCSCIWSPHLTKDIEAIESVQRRYTKRLSCLRHVSYEDRLETVGLERLDVRRLRADLIMTYKIVFGLTCLQFADFFEVSPSRITRGHAFKLFVSGASYADARKYFFSVRITKIWNDLPINTDFSTLCHFKHSILNIDLKKYCMSLH